MATARGLKLNLGCGPVQPAGWVNVDGSNRAWLASRLWPMDRLLTFLHILPRTEFSATTTYADISGRLSWPDGSADAIYLGEVLEHFTREDGEGLLRECHRILQPGGVLRVRVPDTAELWGRYVDEYRLIHAKPRGHWSRDHVRHLELFFADICVRSPGMRSLGHFHKWGYDEVSLILLFESLGFRDAVRMPYQQSRIEDIAAVETQNKLIVEGVKG